MSSISRKHLAPTDLGLTPQAIRCRLSGAPGSGPLAPARGVWAAPEEGWAAGLHFSTLALLAMLLLLPAGWLAAEPADDETEKTTQEAEAHDDSQDAGHGKGHDEGHGKGHSSRLSDVPIPLATLPQRPKPLVELGEPFLGTGTLKTGFELPTGAVWQPSLLLFGNLRLAAQSFEPDDGLGRISELVARLDLFANLQLSGSERLVVGIRATDDGGQFTSYFFEHPDPNLDGEFRDNLDADLEVLFFEGDFGEIFPNLDRDDFGSLDLGFSVGRQQMLFQEGLLINDTIDGIGLTRNTLLPGKSSNFRLTAFYGWGNLDSSLGAERDGELYALLTSTDRHKSTLDADIAYLRTDDGGGDLVAGGLSAVQRLGRMNSSFRLLASRAVDEETALAGDGFLLFNELSWVPPPPPTTWCISTASGRSIVIHLWPAAWVGPAAVPWGGPGSTSPRSISAASTLRCRAGPSTWRGAPSATNVSSTTPANSSSSKSASALAPTAVRSTPRPPPCATNRPTAGAWFW